MASKKEGLRERDRLINEIDELQKKVQSQTKSLEEFEEKNIENEEKIKDLYRQLEDLSNDAFKGKRSLEQVTNKFQEATEEKQYLADELKKYKQQVRVCHFVASLSFFTTLSLSLFQAESEHKVVVQQNMQMLGLRANLDKQTTQNNLNTMKLTRLTGR
jgi:chromosome segregation ATPase